MDRSPLDRRQFHQLMGAAFGGLVAGASAGCSDDKGKGAASTGSSAAADSKPGDVAVKGNIHACRGLNECKGQGADGKNACAGQGICATSKHHSCATQNECKGLGGCGETAGANECKGKGGCSVPMHEGAWEAARKHFEERMKKASKEVGPAPAPKKA